MKKVNGQIIITVASIVIMVVVVMSTSLAVFTWDEESTKNQSIASGSIEVKLTSDIKKLELTNSYPITTKEALDSDAYTFTVSNPSSNADVYYSVKLVSDAEAVLKDECIDNQISTDYINWYIGDVKSGTVHNLGTNNEIQSGILLKSGEDKTINLRIWIDDNASNDVIGAHFHGKLELSYTQATNYTKLSDKILENNLVNENTPDVTKVAVSKEFYDTLTEKTSPTKNQAIVENGLYKNSDNDGYTYYFRGAVNNNFINFGGFTWRIVRINGDGTVRIVLHDAVIGSAFSDIIDNEKYVGYTYDNSSANMQDGTSSVMKTYLENWYKENLASQTDETKNFDNMIAYSRFCSDTIIDNQENDIYYNMNKRFDANNPTFMCPETTQTYGGEYILKVGLLTADEVMFAGSKKNIKNSSFYLNGNTCSYTITPYAFYNSKSHMFIINNDGSIGAIDNLESNCSLRPVISLKSNVRYVKGDGTELNPYIVE